MATADVKNMKELKSALNGRVDVIVLHDTAAKRVFLAEKKFGSDDIFKYILFFVLTPVSFILLSVGMKVIIGGSIGGIIWGGVIELMCFRFWRAYSLQKKYKNAGYYVEYGSIKNGNYIKFDKNVSNDFS